MSMKTVEMEPENVNSLDTYAWIIYNLKRYDEALEYMEKAMDLLDDTADRSVYDGHLRAIRAKVKE